MPLAMRIAQGFRGGGVVFTSRLCVPYAARVARSAGPRSHAKV